MPDTYYPLGVCEFHGPKLSVNGDARCLKCESKAANALKSGPVVTIEDPGHDAVMALTGGKSVDSVPQPKQIVHSASKGEMSLSDIKDAIYKLPMPKSMKQFKRLQKIQQLIDEAVIEG
jgi:hypothetical protein